MDGAELTTRNRSYDAEGGFDSLSNKLTRHSLSWTCHHTVTGTFAGKTQPPFSWGRVHNLHRLHLHKRSHHDGTIKAHKGGTLGIAGRGSETELTVELCPSCEWNVLDLPQSRIGVH